MANLLRPRLVGTSVSGPFSPLPSPSSSRIPPSRAATTIPVKRHSPSRDLFRPLPPASSISEGEDDEPADENLDPNLASPRRKKPRVSADSGFAEEVPDSDGEEDRGATLVFREGAREAVQDAMEGIEREGRAQAPPPPPPTWMPTPQFVNHLDERSIEDLQVDLADYQDRRVSIADQLGEIWKQGGGKSSEGNDAGFLEHNKRYIDDRIGELKAEISRRRGLAVVPPPVSIPGSLLPRSSTSRQSSSSGSVASLLRHPKPAPSTTAVARGASSYASSQSSRSSTSRVQSSPPVPLATTAAPPPPPLEQLVKAPVVPPHRPHLAPQLRAPSPSKVRVAQVPAPAEVASSSRVTSAAPPAPAAPRSLTGFRPASAVLNKVGSSSVYLPPPVPRPVLLAAPSPSKAVDGKGKAPVHDVDPDEVCNGVDFDEPFSFDVKAAAPPPPKRKIAALVIDDDDGKDEEPAPHARRVQLSPSRQPPQQKQPPVRVTTVTAKSLGVVAVAKDALPSVVAVKRTHPWSRDVDKALRQRFGLVGFRENQQKAVDATLSGRDVFVLLPTGGGKSLCYQLPAVVTTGTTRGVTVVVSPLLSLIEDQCKALADKDIPVVSVSSTMPAANRNHAHATLRANPPACCMVYLTPEQIVNSNIMRSMLMALYQRHQLARFVLDEAHCVSSWGHDFRPDYKAMSSLKRDYPGIPLIALTATASRRVKKDVIDNLGMENPVLISASFNRPNLFYEVRPKNKGILADIVTFINDGHKGQCGIIYCFSQKQCEDTAMKLQKEGVNARHYHAGMSAPDRSRIQRGWQNNDFQVICATIAFGMGIDKPDVRYVIHYSIPKNLEGYYQETGRAGRDGKKSVCLLFYSYADTAPLFKHIAEGEGSRDQKEHNKECLRLVVQYCLNITDCRRQQVLQYFNENFSPDDCHKACDNCLRGDDQSQREDVTELAKKAIRLVQSFGSGENVTLLSAVDIFRGSKGQKIVAKGYDKLPLAGAGEKTNRNDVERLFQILSAQGIFGEHLERSKLGYTNAYIKLGPNATEVLNGRRTVAMDVARTAGAAAGPVRAKVTKRPSMAMQVVDEDVDEESDDETPAWDPLGRKPPPPTARQSTSGGNTIEELCFADLCELRDELATAADCEPHVIISDESLQALALLRPTDYSSYCRVEGCDEDSYDSFFSAGGKKIVKAYVDSAAPVAGPSRPATGATRPPAAGASRPPAERLSRPSTTKHMTVGPKSPTSKSTVAPAKKAKNALSKLATNTMKKAGVKSHAQLNLTAFMGPDAMPKRSKSAIKAMPMPKKK